MDVGRAVIAFIVVCGICKAGFKSTLTTPEYRLDTGMSRTRRSEYTKHKREPRPPKKRVKDRAEEQELFDDTPNPPIDPMEDTPWRP